MGRPWPGALKTEHCAAVDEDGSGRVAAATI